MLRALVFLVALAACSAPQRPVVVLVPAPACTAAQQQQQQPEQPSSLAVCGSISDPGCPFAVTPNLDARRWVHGPWELLASIWSGEVWLSLLGMRTPADHTVCESAVVQPAVACVGELAFDQCHWRCQPRAGRM